MRVEIEGAGEALPERSARPEAAEELARLELDVRYADGALFEGELDVSWRSRSQAGVERERHRPRRAPRARALRPRRSRR